MMFKTKSNVEVTFMFGKYLFEQLEFQASDEYDAIERITVLKSVTKGKPSD